MLKHLGGSGLSVKFQEMAEYIAKSRGLSTDTVFIDKVYNQIETWYKTTYFN